MGRLIHLAYRQEVREENSCSHRHETNFIQEIRTGDAVYCDEKISAEIVVDGQVYNGELFLVGNEYLRKARIRVHPECQHFTAYDTHEGHFEFTRMPFGLVNMRHEQSHQESAIRRSHGMWSICVVSGKALDLWLRCVVGLRPSHLDVYGRHTRYMREYS